ncbi:MAG: MYXO-CTERM sorting domain-containing protein [Sandaracinaceae bacterium]
MTRASLLVACLLVIPCTAAADAIGPPPTTCPPGSTGISCHGPETCEVTGCTGDGDCAANETCAARGLCVEQHCCGGISCFIDGSAPAWVTHASAACTPGGPCAMGECQTLMVCVPRAGVDGGNPGTDGGNPGTDGGSSGTDAGGAAMDGGNAGTDAGGARMDGGGTSGVDAGSGGTDGGCCSVSGRESRVAPVLGMIAMAWLVFRRRRE